MTPAVEIAAIAAPTVLALAGLGVVAVAREWVTISVTVRAVPAARRKPKTAVEVIQAVPAAPPGAVVEHPNARGKGAA